MENPLKILMLEDSIEDAEMVQHSLLNERPDCEFKLVMTEDDYVMALDKFRPDLILSDNTLPQFNATVALEIFNARALHIPFILVTGTVSEEFAANIIKSGADDYILKDRLYRLPAAVDAALKKRKAEREIRFNTTLLNAVGQAVIATDITGIVIYWNRAAEQIYGWTIVEATGKNIIELVTSQQTREEAALIMNQLMQGHTWSGEFIVQRKDGTLFSAFVTNSPVYNERGIVTAIIGVSTDISERKKTEANIKMMEQELLNQKVQEQKKITRAIIKAQENERSHIGLELHDNINQILAGTKIYLSIAGKKDVMVQELVKYPMELIDNSINEIRLLSSRYVAPVKNVELKAMLEALVHNMNATGDIRAVFTYDLANDIEDDDLKLNIYRILQEQVNNILKHARAKNVSVSIDATADKIRILVTDDGMGFDPEKKRNGIGISNIINRTESFNGEVEIKTAIGKGCTIEIRIPFNVSHTQ